MIPAGSRGGSEGYVVPHRLLLIDLYEAGHEVPASNIRSIQRWIKDGVVPKRKTGNKPSTAMTGEHLLLLAIFKRFYPQASRPECAVFICIHSSDGRVLTNAEMSMGLKKLGMSRKNGSTTAYRAFTPENLFLHRCFWQCEFPGGIGGVPRRRLADADEMSFDIGDANLNCGHAVKGCRIRKTGNYDGERKKSLS